MVAGDPGKVINELVVRLISLYREASGIADNAASRYRIRICESEDRRVVPRRNVNQSVTKPEAISEFPNDVVRKDMRPVEAVVLLLIVLICTLTDHHILGSKD